MTPFWYKRICEVAIIISAVVIALFIWHTMMPQDILARALPIGMPLAVGALVVLLLGSVAYGKTPEQYMARIAPVIYLASVGVFGWMIVSTGFISSPLLGLWMLLAVFAGLFGWWGVGAGLVLANVFLVVSTVMFPASRLDIVLATITLILPVVVSYMLWHGNSTLFRQQGNGARTLHDSLKSEAAKSDTIIQSISDGVIMTKASGEVVLINPAAQRMTGWSAADALRLQVASILRLEDEQGNPVQDGLHPVMTVLSKRQPIRSTLAIVTKSDKRVIAAFSVTPLDDGGVIAVFRDITKERAEEREQAEFISTASHEMRTPVAAIEGFLGLALSPKVATIDEKAREYVGKAHESAQYLGRLLKDLLEISRAEDGRLHNDMVVIEAVQLGHQVTDSLQQKAEEKGLSLVYQPLGSKNTTGDTTIAPILYTRADRDRLRESLANLIENAIKYTPSGQVVVDVTAHRDQVRFSVKDNGIGIPAEDVPHLFQKFYRVDNSDTREIGGTGLGLYLVRKLIESMNGKVGVESEYHKGSLFYIDLPRVNREQAVATLESDKRRAERQAAQEEEIARQTASSEVSLVGANEDDKTSLPQPTTVLSANVGNVPAVMPPIAPDIPGAVTPPTVAAAAPVVSDVAYSPTQISTGTLDIAPPEVAVSVAMPTIEQLQQSFATPKARPVTQISAPSVQATPRHNTPLSTIERNTQDYLVRRHPPQGR